MKNNLVFEKEAGHLAFADYTALKLTSLLYLKEALQKEQYEDCAELIEKAREFGANTSDISQIIADYIRRLNNGRRNGANQRRLFS